MSSTRSLIVVRNDRLNNKLNCVQKLAAGANDFSLSLSDCEDDEQLSQMTVTSVSFDGESDLVESLLMLEAAESSVKLENVLFKKSRSSST